jgi:hypothetical protein
VAAAALVLAIVSAVVALVSLYFARRAAEAAVIATRIELDRRHAELRPSFRVTCEKQGGEHLRLAIALTGPPELGHLDELVVTIRDSNYFRLKPLTTAGAPAPDQVWGPVRFVPGTGLVPPRVPAQKGRTPPAERPGRSGCRWAKHTSTTLNPLRLLRTGRQSNGAWRLARLFSFVSRDVEKAGTHGLLSARSTPAAALPV